MWGETSLDLAGSPWPEGVALDVVLSDPERDAPRLYDLAPVLPFRRIRVTIPAAPGVAKAGMLAIALHFPVRLLPGQPRPDVVEQLERILDRYLHDPSASEPVEFFHSALATLLHGCPAGLWEVLEQDPALFRRIPDDGEGPPPPVPPVLPQEANFVANHRARLVATGSECAECPFLEWCEGFFKWPHPDYGCRDVRRLLGLVEVAAAALRRDVVESGER